MKNPVSLQTHKVYVAKDNVVKKILLNYQKNPTKNDTEWYYIICNRLFVCSVLLSEDNNVRVWLMLHQFLLRTKVKNNTIVKEFSWSIQILEDYGYIYHGLPCDLEINHWRTSFKFFIQQNFYSGVRTLEGTVNVHKHIHANSCVEWYFYACFPNISNKYIVQYNWLACTIPHSINILVISNSLKLVKNA